ncbi:MAG: hypothetical protein KDA87_16375 [Planctomycetales bacterium]|nr:hypothetical protein [Planctomycetales bacterium]
MATATASTSCHSPIHSPPDYLCVDRFLESAVYCRSLASAFRCGWIDSMLSAPQRLSELAQGGALDPTAAELLVGLLRQGGVIERTELDTAESEASFRLTDEFRQALAFRDLLETKMEFANLLAVDWIDRFDQLLADTSQFMAESRLLQLFSYQRCFEYSPENYANTKRWMRLTTALTRYETPEIVDSLAFDSYRDIVDVGGNSGEFAKQLCRRFARLHATVFDLPLVCEIGREHLAGTAESDRIQFQAGNALQDALPSADVYTFKSMLHDWPEAESIRFLERAFSSLRPGGQLIIFERMATDWSETPWTYGSLPTLLFFRSYRRPAFYLNQLERIGFQDLECLSIQLDMPFMLIQAKRYS